MNQHQPNRVYRLVVLTVMSLALVGCGTARAALPAATPVAVATSSAVTQTNEGGQVTVTATWAGRAVGPVFTIVLDTHSVDLDGIDLTTRATLSADGIQVRPTAWDAPAGGHHRKGALAFPTRAEDGRSIIGPETKTIELVIRDVAGVPERSFRWNVSP